jgi:predicted transglutaminase-like cysteine proteinase
VIVTISDEIAAINTYVNTLLTYTPDDNRNHWQTLSESMERGKGDCEDYACAKFHLLHNAGYKSYLAQVTTSDGQAHMVCVCVGNGCILDNINTNLCTIQERADLSTPIFTLHIDCILCAGETLPVDRSAKWLDWLKRSGLYEG